MKNMSIKLHPHQVLVIAGQTASGKSSLAIELAQKYNGEIISADSRQIYRGMDIGTGKVTREEQALAKHHLIDICHPNDEYNVTDFKRDAEALIADIQSRGKLPIICGGTGFWIQALVDNQSFPAVPPNKALRAELAKVPCEELFKKLKAIDPQRAKTIDAKNAFRLIRALEIIEALGTVPPLHDVASRNNYVIIAIHPSKEKLDAKIRTRLEERFDQDMIGEVKRLHSKGISWEKLDAFGLEYRWIAQFVQRKINDRMMHEKLYFDIVHYSKRQLTWLHRWEKQGARIHWVQDASQVDMVI